MGVDRKDYLMIGYKMPYDVKFSDGNELANLVYEDEEKYMPFCEGWENEPYRIIIDGMSGKYIVFGYPLDESDEYGGFGFRTIDFNEVESRMQETRNKAIEVFNDIDFDFSKPEIFCFSHYH